MCLGLKVLKLSCGAERALTERKTPLPAEHLRVLLPRVYKALLFPLVHASTREQRCRM